MGDTVSVPVLACGCFSGYILVIPLTRTKAASWRECRAPISRTVFGVSRGTAEKLEIEGVGESGQVLMALQLTLYLCDFYLG